MKKFIAVGAVALAAAFALTRCGGEEPAGKASSGLARAAARLPEHPRHTDHATFFDQPLADGPAVTRACLKCHPQASQEVMKTAHWKWEGDEVVVPGHDKPTRIGKKNVINNFCIGIPSNWAACTSCHAGYGWEDASFDFKAEDKVDCLVCHAAAGTYQKKPKGAGLPAPGTDLLAAAKSVGAPKRQNCGACHFSGGGGNAVKHGDLDNSLLFPTERIDVHMGERDLQCTDCHRTERHAIPGRSMSVSVDDKNRVRCTDCHAAAPHGDERLNRHTAKVACQACHIPYMAVKEGTKTSWDWSQAGQDTDIKDQHVYMKIKGRFTWAKAVLPEYAWYDETSTRYLLGDKIDPSKPTKITEPLGSRKDPKSKLWPFKVHRGKQIYDTENQYFVIPQTAGTEGYWTKFDWAKAAENGAKATGLAYSGKYDFAATEMYWPLSHMVVPKEQALQCRDCHGSRGRLDWKALGYPRDPLGDAPLRHPAVPLKDAQGKLVRDSGAPLSTRATCSACHELDGSDFLGAHGYHRKLDPASLPPERRALLERDGPRVAKGEESNCLLCHLGSADPAARTQALASAEPAWSIAATLGPQVVAPDASGAWKWSREALGAEGELKLRLQRASEASCGACHGAVHDGATPLALAADEAGYTSETTGQVFSPQRVRESALNLAGKDALSQPWDVHAERLVSCRDCHYSEERPERLDGEATRSRTGLPGVRRRCESCHSLDGLHGWLPEKERHLAAVACESCHVPQQRLAALEQVDRTALRADGRPLKVWRGLSGPPEPLAQAYLTGFRPVLLEGRGGDNLKRVTPYNLVATWRWTSNGAPVADELVARAWLDGSSHRGELVTAFDADKDGKLSELELRLDRPEKVARIAKNLEALGVAAPTIAAELRPYGIHHGVGRGAWANKDCQTCHAPPQPVQIAPYLPGGVRPAPVASGVELGGRFEQGADGSLLFTPNAIAPAGARSPTP